MSKTTTEPAEPTLAEIRSRIAMLQVLEQQAVARENAAQAVRGLEALLAKRAAKIEADAAVRKEYDEKRRRLDELDVELGVLEREVPHLHNKLTWQRPADSALRAEYDTKRASWD
jgi:hypothetical protein